MDDVFKVYVLNESKDGFEHLKDYEDIESAQSYANEEFSKNGRETRVERWDEQGASIIYTVGGITE